jgi:hypothetical protein
VIAMLHSVYISIAKSGKRLALGGRTGFRPLLPADIGTCPRFEVHLFDGPADANKFMRDVSSMPERERPKVVTDNYNFSPTKTVASLVVWPGQTWTPTPPVALSELLRDHRSGKPKAVRLNDTECGGMNSPIQKPAWSPPTGHDLSANLISPNI